MKDDQECSVGSHDQLHILYWHSLLTCRI